MDRFQQLFLLARNHGKKEPSEWAHYAWKTLDAQNLKIVKEGNLLETASDFAVKCLPVLRALQVV